MATTVDFAQTQIISVLRADMTLVQSVPVEIRELDLDAFRSDLKDLEAGNNGMPWPDTHEHTAPLPISGVILARVVEVKPPYTLTFEDGLYNVNIVGGNSNVSDRTNKNQVGVNTANSAGLQDLSSLQASSFDGVIAIDTTSTNTGTTFPVGTRSFPVNNIADANSIADERGIPVFAVASALTLDVTDFSSGHTFLGDNPSVILTINTGTNVDNAEFRNLTVQGVLDTNNVFRKCFIEDITMFDGVIDDCTLSGTVTLGGAGTAKFYSCKSGVAGGGVGQTAAVDMGGASGTDLIIRDYQGGVKITNCSSAVDASIDMSSGRVIFESTVTAGTFYVRGIADVTDLSTGTAVVVDQTLTNKVGLTAAEQAQLDRAEIVYKAFLNKGVTTDIGGGQKRIDFYDDDQLTVIDSVTISADGNTRTNP